MNTELSDRIKKVKQSVKRLFVEIQVLDMELEDLVDEFKRGD